ncbi:alpha-glucosidase [Desemzia sp. FAM 23991]|uniref:alpha-glucosidase n=1 Tax=unclassified Desemzia TaxID=2685243 RepID=UPI0038888A4C
MEEKWWQQAIVYQIYPGSFQDTGKNGLGDLRGIINRLKYIQSLGVTVIWLNPIFESPYVDNGYDVSDYYAIDPVFGTMEEVDELLTEAHKLGLKVIFDLVLNHTSDQHPWFQEALKGRDNPYRDFYIWSDPRPGGQLPNNWASFFGGSVWEKEPIEDQFYFHLFAKEMPDLNWNNEAVQREIVKIAEYWLDKGVDGFRLDAFIHLDKAEGFPDVEAEEGEIVLAEEYYSNLENVTDYIADVARVLRKKKPDIFILGEAASADVEMARRYSDPKNEACDTVVSFRFFPMDESHKDPRLPFNMQKDQLDIAAFKEIMTDFQNGLEDIGGPTLYWNNHDMARMVSRFGDVENGRDNSVKMLATLMYLQKGIPILLNGEEIGMKDLEQSSLDDFKLPNEQFFREKALELGYSEDFVLHQLNAKSINASRGVMQWDTSEYAGFSTVPPWSGVNIEPSYTVEMQEKNEFSILNYYRQLLKYKKTPLFTKGQFRLLETNHQLYCYERQLGDLTAIVCCNFDSQEATFIDTRLTKFAYNVLIANENNRVETDKIILAPHGAIVIVFDKGTND